MVFNDTIWSVHPSSINVHDKYVAVNGFDVSRDKQYIKIDGVASDNDDDEVCVFSCSMSTLTIYLKLLTQRKRHVWRHYYR